MKKISYILDGGEKGKLILLFFLMLIGAALEMAGVSLVFPMISLITGEGSRDAVRVAELAALLIIIYLVKNLFLTGMYAAIFRFVYNGAMRLSSRMMEAYLSADYAFHLNKNAAAIDAAIRYDSESVYKMMKALLQLAAEIIICIVLAVWLLFTDVAMSLFLFVLVGSVCGLFLVFSKKTTKRLGKEDIRIREQTERQVLTAFGGIKEVKLLGREDYFLENVTEHSRELAKNNRRQQLLLQLPRLLVETVCISGVMCIILFEVIRGEDITQLIPKLGVFAVAAFRLLPSVGKINSLTSEVLFYRAAADAVYEDLEELETLGRDNELPEEAAAPVSWEKNLTAEKLVFRYTKDGPEVLSDCSLEIPYGAAVGLIGPSGAGKTTLADLLMGMLHPESGRILADGEDIEKELRSWQRQIGYVPQNIYLSDDTIRANVAFGLREDEIDDERVWTVLKQAQLEDFVKESPDGLNMQVGERGVRLSGGQRQRIAIARALYHDPQLLVFDEATSALDNDTEEAVMQAIDALHGSRTMIIIAHRLTTIRSCDLVYRVEAGKVTKELPV
ncbi:MAG: ABC transporter ATP-binding protein [Lachnospiraceae bacterium]|nr:ABC transporter ATP-binding protein [Lachnospiraceae bacterium]